MKTHQTIDLWELVVGIGISNQPLIPNSSIQGGSGKLLWAMLNDRTLTSSISDESYSMSFEEELDLLKSLD